MATTKILDATSGTGDFQSIDRLLNYRLEIIGTPSANIKAFYTERGAGFGGFFLSLKCANWNGASVKMFSKSNHPDDYYSETGDTFTSNTLKTFYYY